MHRNWKFVHVAMVVKDMEKSIRYFETLGVGPFKPFIGGAEGIPVTGTVRGRKVDYDMDLRMGEGGMGGAPIELIQPLKGRTIYDEFLEEKGEGVHHLCFIVEDLDKETAKMAKKGYKVLQTGATSGAKWAYFDTDRDGGVVTELAQPLGKPPA